MSNFFSRSFCAPVAAALSISLAGCSALGIGHPKSCRYANPGGGYASPESAPATLELAPYAEPAIPAPAPAVLESWPGDSRGLVYQLPATSNNGLEFRGKAQRGAGALDLTGGSVIIGTETSEQLLAACRASNELTIDVLLWTAQETQSGPARVVTFSTDSESRNFTLGQDAEFLMLRLRTPQTGPNGMPPEVRLARATPGVPQHLIVTYRPGLLACYVNGEEVLRTDQVQGDFSNWSPHTLLLGDELSGDRDWSGHIARLALRSRFVEASEARNLHELLMQEHADR